MVLRLCSKQHIKVSVRSSMNCWSSNRTSVCCRLVEYCFFKLILRWIPFFFVHRMVKRPFMRPPCLAIYRLWSNWLRPVRITRDAIETVWRRPKWPDNRIIVPLLSIWTIALKKWKNVDDNLKCYIVNNARLLLTMFLLNNIYTYIQNINHLIIMMRFKIIISSS